MKLGINYSVRNNKIKFYDFEDQTTECFGGTTTIIPFACQYKGENLREVIKDYHHRAENKSYIDYAFHTIISDVNKTTPIIPIIV